MFVDMVTGGSAGGGLGRWKMTRNKIPPNTKTKTRITTVGHQDPFPGADPLWVGGGGTPSELAGFGVSSGMAFLSVSI